LTAAAFLEQAVPDVEGPILGDGDLDEARAIIARYPDARSAMVPLLYLVQSKVGWIPQQGMREVGELLGLQTAEVQAVATFYTMLKLRPTGRYVLSVCTNPSCGIRGGYALFDHAREHLEGAEHVTADGLFTVEEEECLGACDKAPVLSVNYVYFDRVTTDAFDEMVEQIRAGSVPEAARGGVPGDLKEISRVLAGLAAGGTTPAAEPHPATEAPPPEAPPPPPAAEPQPQALPPEEKPQAQPTNEEQASGTEGERSGG
jgi:NADH-quinone oxidoreductase subunit E